MLLYDMQLVAVADVQSPKAGRLFPGLRLFPVMPYFLLLLFGKGQLSTLVVRDFVKYFVQGKTGSKLMETKEPCRSRRTDRRIFEK